MIQASSQLCPRCPGVVGRGWLLGIRDFQESLWQEGLLGFVSGNPRAGAGCSRGAYGLLLQPSCTESLWLGTPCWGCRTWGSEQGAVGRCRLLADEGSARDAVHAWGEDLVTHGHLG